MKRNRPNRIKFILETFLMFGILGATFFIFDEITAYFWGHGGFIVSANPELDMSWKRVTRFWTTILSLGLSFCAAYIGTRILLPHSARGKAQEMHFNRLLMPVVGPSVFILFINLFLMESMGEGLRDTTMYAGALLVMSIPSTLLAICSYKLRQ